MYYGLKQGQITPNIENIYVLKVIHLVALCKKFEKISEFHYFYRRNNRKEQNGKRS